MAERLTVWIDENNACTSPYIRNNGHQRCTNKLAHYEDLEEQVFKNVGLDLHSLLGEFMHYYDLQKQGRLKELPCAEGTPIWYLGREQNSETCEPEYFVGKCGFELFMIHKLGKKYFLTKEAALEKLREKRSEEL